jgi:hypothetical protein
MSTIAAAPVLTPAGSPAGNAGGGWAPPTPPHWRTIVRTHLRAVAAGARRELVAAGGLVAALTLLVLFESRDGSGMAFELMNMNWPVVLLGLLAPMSVWRSDTPSRRAYFWSMPVDRRRHTLMKVFAGWAWLMVLVAAYLLWAVTVAWASGGSVASGVDAVAGVDTTLRAHPWMWLVPFTVTTAMYLFGSIAAVASDHPWRWVGGVYIGTVLVAQAGAQWAERVTEAPIWGRFGLIALMTGTAPAPGTTGPLEQATHLPSAVAWAGATLIWTAVAVAGLHAAIRRQER